jgi:hypothetical protein
VGDDTRGTERFGAGPPARIDGELLIAPIDVGSAGVQNEGGTEREPWAMTVTIDLDAVPHLREAFERHASGVAIDTTTQWHTMTHEDVGVSPLAFLRVEFPEFGVVFNVGFAVDEYRRSLAVAARTGLVVLLEPALSEAMRLESPKTAMRDHQSIALSVSGVEPLRRALSQRFDLPFPERTVPREEHRPEEAPEAFTKFLEGGTESPAFAISAPAGQSPVIIIADDQAAAAAVGASDERLAHWSSALLGPHSVARLDLLDGERILWTAVWANPPAALLRSTSSSAHFVAIVAGELSESPARLSAQLENAIDFPVEEAAEAMRALLRD